MVNCRRRLTRFCRARSRERAANVFEDFGAVIACLIETRSEWQYNRPTPIL